MPDLGLAAGPRLALLAAAVLSLAWAVGAIAAVDPGADLETSYAAASSLALVADAAAGIGLILAGGLACTQSRTRRLGVLVALAGVAWFGADWEGSEHGPALLRSLGAVIAPFTLVLVLHAALAFPGGRLRSPGACAVAVAAYGIAATVSAGRATLRDPLLDLYCWRNCRDDNSFLVHADPGIASALEDVWHWSALAIGAGLVGLGAWRLLGASAPARRTLLPVLGPAMLVGMAEAAYAVALIPVPAEDPLRSGFAAIFLARALSLAALAFGVAWIALRIPRLRARVAQLASDFGEAPRPGTLRDALAAALGDSELEVVYPRHGGRGLIDAEGRAAEPAAAGRATALITRGDRSLALVLHDPALADERQLERALGAAAKLSVENEALRAEALAQLVDLRASRVRIVTSGDATRNRIERNLHDGAQQSLLALSYRLRLDRASAASAGDEKLVALLDAAGGETSAALDELREIAHGIHPAILSEAGLGPALATLADDAPLPVTLQIDAAGRFPPAVETTAYIAAADAIADAARREATKIGVRLAEHDGRLVVTAEDDGAPHASELLHLSDRVGALGGLLQIGSTTLSVEIPCA